MPYPPTRGAGQHPRSAPARLRSKDIMNPDRTLTKAELAELLFDRVGLNKSEAKDIVDTFFEEIRESLARGVEVKLSGFGNFQVRGKPPRPGRNPKTGEVRSEEHTSELQSLMRISSDVFCLK